MRLIDAEINAYYVEINAYNAEIKRDRRQSCLKI